MATKKTKKPAKKFKFPLVKNGWIYPDHGTHRCPVCGENLLGNFIALGGGGMKVIDKKKHFASMFDLK